MAQAAVGALGTPLALQGDLLRHAGGFAVQVGLECTALIPALVLVAVLAAFGWMGRTSPSRLVRAMLFSVAVITLINQLRLVGVIWVGVHAPQHFAWVHEVLGPLLMIAVGAAIVAATVRIQVRVPAGAPHAATR